MVSVHSDSCQVLSCDFPRTQTSWCGISISHFCLVFWVAEWALNDTCIPPTSDFHPEQPFQSWQESDLLFAQYLRQSMARSAPRVCWGFDHSHGVPLGNGGSYNDRSGCWPCWPRFVLCVEHHFVSSSCLSSPYGKVAWFPLFVRTGLFGPRVK